MNIFICSIQGIPTFCQGEKNRGTCLPSTCPGGCSCTSALENCSQGTVHGHCQQQGIGSAWSTHGLPAKAAQDCSASPWPDQSGAGLSGGWAATALSLLPKWSWYLPCSLAHLVRVQPGFYKDASMCLIASRSCLEITGLKHDRWEKAISNLCSLRSHVRRLKSKGSLHRKCPVYSRRTDANFRNLQRVISANWCP